MKTERKFSWCVRYYDVKSGTVSYRVFVGLSVREINEETNDLRHLITMALMKLFNFNTDSETYHIEHIDSISHLHDMDK